MKKAVMLSIQPKWVDKIIKGEKTIEVRKNRPKLETPFKCYIYETQGATETPWVDEDGHFLYIGRGQVIGEFICDRIEIITRTSDEELQRQTCLTGSEMRCYADDKDIYAWHISDLKIYDKPKELSEFRLHDKTLDYAFWGDIDRTCQIKRPPQSWCYVENI